MIRANGITNRIHVTKRKIALWVSKIVIGAGAATRRVVGRMIVIRRAGFTTVPTPAVDAGANTPRRFGSSDVVRSARAIVDDCAFPNAH